MKKDTPIIGFNLKGIKTEQFVLFAENYNSKKQVQLRQSLQVKLDKESKQLGIFLGFEFAQTKKVFLKIEVSCHFGIEVNSWNQYLIKEKNVITFPKGFVAHLTMITTGTARGILFAKTEGTEYCNFLVPPINVLELIPEDVTFELAND